MTTVLSRTPAPRSLGANSPTGSQWHIKTTDLLDFIGAKVMKRPGRRYAVVRATCPSLGPRQRRRRRQPPGGPNGPADARRASLRLPLARTPELGVCQAPPRPRFGNAFLVTRVCSNPPKEAAQRA